MNPTIIGAIVGSLITGACVVWTAVASGRSNRRLEQYKASQVKEDAEQKTLGDVYVKAQGVYDVLVGGLREEIDRLARDNAGMRAEMAAMRRDLDRMRNLLIKHSISYEEKDPGP